MEPSHRYQPPRRSLPPSSSESVEPSGLYPGFSGTTVMSPRRWDGLDDLADQIHRSESTRSTARLQQYLRYGSSEPDHPAYWVELEPMGIGVRGSTAGQE